MLFEISSLKSLRKQMNLTQSEFARKAGVSQSMIAKIESGRLDPSYSNVRKITETIEKLSHEQETRAKDVMIRKVISINANEKLKDIIKLLNKHDISQVPVMKNNRIAGIIYESTILEKVGNKEFSELTAGDIMEDTPPLVSEDTGMSAVSSLLRHFPIVLITSKGELTGVITKVDILKKFI